jgi:hypothetical protein
MKSNSLNDHLDRGGIAAADQLNKEYAGTPLIAAYCNFMPAGCEGLTKQNR